MTRRWRLLLLMISKRSQVGLAVGSFHCYGKQGCATAFMRRGTYLTGEKQIWDLGPRTENQKLSFHNSQWLAVKCFWSQILASSTIIGFTSHSTGLKFHKFNKAESALLLLQTWKTGPTPNPIIPSKHFIGPSRGLIITWLALKQSSGVKTGSAEIFWSSNLLFLLSWVSPPSRISCTAGFPWPGAGYISLEGCCQLLLLGVRSCKSMCPWVWARLQPLGSAPCAAPDWWQRDTYHWRQDTWNKNSPHC